MLATLCEERMPGTRYDRYYMEEFSKKVKNTEEIEEIVSRLKEIEGDSEVFKEAFEQVIKENQSAQEQQRMQSKKEEQVKKQEESKKGEWTTEELSKLQKGIIKYPGAALNRWKLITEFIDSDKTQKQVIAKAQELAQK